MRKIFVLLLAALFPSFAHAAGTFDLTEAKGKQNPVLVFVHGGAWVSGDKADYPKLAPAFTKEGFCVVRLNYGLAPASVHPEPVKDLESVLETLAKTPNEHCDIGRLFLLGHSAGAHLIAYWATAYQNSAVKGLVGLEGIYDLPNLAKVWPTYPDWFLKKEFGQAPAWPLASPTRLAFLEKAPWLLIQSKADELVDVAQTTEFEAHLKKIGVPVETLILSKGRHDEVMRNLGEANEETARVLAFLRAKK